MCWSRRGLLAGGKVPRYMSAIIRDPAIAPQATNLFNKSVSPTPKSPSMKSQSTATTPERLLKNSANGPSVEFMRNPEVGEPPLSQEFSLLVANPKPKSLSANAQRKMSPITKRNFNHIIFLIFMCLIIAFVTGLN